MIAAIAAVQTGNMSIRDAVDKFIFSKSSLANRKSGRVIYGSKPGPKRMLTTEEETKLAAYLIDISKQGYAKYKEITLFMATQIAVKHGTTVKGGCLSDMWWRKFVKRHPQVSRQISRNSAMSQTSVNKEAIGLMYTGLLKAMCDNEYGNLNRKPHLIFSASESGFDLDSVNKIVAASTGPKRVPAFQNGQREQVSVLSCVSASGGTISPMFICRSQSGLVSYDTQESTPGASILFSHHNLGWTDNDLYLKWFREVFFPSIPAERPVLLLVDGQTAHVTSDAVDKHNFAKYFDMAWNTTIAQEVIREDFRNSGIFPLNPQAFDYSKLEAKKASATTTKQNKLPFTRTLSVPASHLSVLPPPPSATVSTVKSPQVQHNSV